MEIIIAPHMDDAFLSMGGRLLLHKKQNNSHVLTVFNSMWSCNSSFINDDVNRRNKLEHQRVMSFTDCSFSYWDYPESYQRGYKGWNSPLNKNADKLLYEEIKLRLTRLLYDDYYQVYFFPMAIEAHADHELIFLALLEVINDSFLASNEVYLYEDLPYSFYVDMNKWIKMREVGLELIPLYIDITNVVDDKQRILELYKTQVEQRDIQATIKYAYSIISDGRPYERMWQIIRVR